MSDASLSIKSEVEIVHLLYHRHHNQHRHSEWWKYFSIFHRRCRQINHMLQTDPHRKKRNISLQSQFLVEKIIPQAYRNVNSMLAQEQFISLGLAVIGCLGKLYVALSDLIIREEKVKRKLKSTEKLKVIEKEKLEATATAAAMMRTMTAIENLTDNSNGNVNTNKTSAPKKDLGQAISRDSFLQLKSKEQPKKRPSSDEPSKEPKKKKSKKKKNAIDDIFGF